MRNYTAKHTFHGYGKTGSKPREYHQWQNMKQRCSNPKASGYDDYGARGVRVCDRWEKSFVKFLADMGRCPAGFTIERIKNSGNYEPGNCRWASRKDQNNNTTRNHQITFRGQTKTMAQWAEDTGLSYTLIRRRLWLGWTVDDVFTKPIKRSRIRSALAA
jgi:hypothetical protein